MNINEGMTEGAILDVQCYVLLSGVVVQVRQAHQDQVLLHEQDRRGVPVGCGCSAWTWTWKTCYLHLGA